MATAEDARYFESAGRHVSNLLNLLRQWGTYEGPTPEDPAVLGAISTPVLADHIPDARIHELAGVGHAAPLTHLEALAAALPHFFSPAEQPV